MIIVIARILLVLTLIVLAGLLVWGEVTFILAYRTCQFQPVYWQCMANQLEVNNDH